MFGDDYPTPDGTPIRDYIDVRDLADAHIRALEATGRSDAETTQVFNLGRSTGVSVREVIAAAEAVVGHPIPVTIGPRREGDPPILVATSAKATATLGWVPKHGSLEQMVGSAWAWRRRNPHGYPANGR
jgi:UDP-glucose 4-epimerase